MIQLSINISNFILGLVKFVVLCHLITTRKKELKPDERLEIIKYAKSRLPLFLKQLHQLMKAIKSTFSGMTSMQRFDIATYVVPEVCALLFFVSNCKLICVQSLQFLFCF